MNKILIAILMTAVLAASSFAGEPDTAAVAEQMKSLEAMCEASASDRTARQTAEPLYDRLGGYDRILALTTEVVRLHENNEAIKGMLVHVDPAALAKHVADFIAAGTGGTTKYTGRDLPSSHAHLNLTDADFLSAGGDIITAMQTLKYGQEEIDDLVCIFVSLKDQVVFTDTNKK